MTRADIERQLAQHKEAYARRDIEALAAGHLPQGTFESPAYPTVHGRDAIRDVYRYWFAAFPDMVLTWNSPVIDPPRASFFWTLDGTTAGQFFGEVKAGSKVHIVGASEVEFSADGMIAIRHVFDFSGALVRTGALKVKPS